MSASETAEDRTPGLGPAALAAGYLALTLAPLAAAWAAVPRAGPFWPEMATGLALAGFAMLFVQFVLSGRFRFVSGRIGIDLVMRFHQLAARALTVFLVLHPLLYGAPRAVADPGAYLAGLARMFAAPAFATGVIAWLGLLILVAMALWRARLGLTYEAWRLSHGLGALAVALAGLHHALTVGSPSPTGPVAAVWGALAALAAATLAHVYLLRPLLLWRRPYRVTAVRAVGPGRWTLTVAPEDGRPLPFRAGQFVWLTVGPSPFGFREHPFSIASAPSAGAGLEFLIREAGDFTRTVGAIAPGTRAWVDGPYGAFVLPPPGGPAAPARVVLIAGGVGLAPILSILREAALRGDPRAFHLICGNRTEVQIVARDELAALRDRLALEVDHVLSEPPAGWPGAVGRLDADTLGPLLAGAGDDALYLLCGPPAMVTAAEGALTAREVPARRIVAERFDYDRGEDGETAMRQRRVLHIFYGLSAALLLAVVLFALR